MKLAIPSTTDSEANEIMKILINKKAKDLENVVPVVGEIIKPLYLFLDKEVLLYAKLKKLKFKELKEKKDEISGFLDEVEKKHPEVKQAIVKGILSLN